MVELENLPSVLLNDKHFEEVEALCIVLRCQPLLAKGITLGYIAEKIDLSVKIVEFASFPDSTSHITL